MRYLILFLMIPLPALAEAFDRPIPNPQSATAVFWFSLATIALLLSLAAVGWLVHRR